MLNCDGYSTVKYLLNRFPELKEYLEPMAKVNENAIIYPCYGIAPGMNGKSDCYVIRFMGKNQLPLIEISGTDKVEYFHPVTRKIPISDLDIQTIYEFKNSGC